MSSVENILFNDQFLKVAAEEYAKFKKTSDWDEEYKWNILSGLNDKFLSGGISIENIVEKIKLLEENNPQEGSFVHWSEVDYLKKAAEKNPEIVVFYINSLIDENKSLSDRIDNARMKLQEASKGNFGTPLTGYILASFNKNKYPIFKDEIFRHFVEVMNLDLDFKTADIGKKYEKYVEICNNIADYLEKNDLFTYTPSILDGQDFLYCISRYDNLRYKIYIRYLFNFAKTLKNYENRPQIFLNDICKMEQPFLKIEMENYRGGEKIRKIRFLVLERILGEEKLSLEEFKEILENVNEQYDGDILHSWDEFKILFQIYFDLYKKRINYFLRSLHTYFKNQDTFSETQFKENEVINDFLWNQNFGGTSCWIALYPNSIVSHKIAPQLFLGIYDDAIMYGLCYGSEIEDQYENDFEKIHDEEEINVTNILKKFVQVYPKFKDFTGIEPSEKINYWKIAPGRNAKHWDKFIEKGIIAINWSKYNDLGSFRDLSKEEIAEQLGLNVASSNVVYAFDVIVNQINIGDYIVANKGKNKIVGIGKVISDYVYDDSEPINRHQRKVEWIHIGEKEVEYDFGQMTITTIGKTDFNNFIAQYKSDLVEPFSTIFSNREEAYWAFELIRKTFERLDIVDENDQRFAVTIVHNQKMLRVNIGNWSVIHFENKGKSQTYVGMALLQPEQIGLETEKDVRLWTPFKDSEKEVRGAEIPINLVRSQDNIILDHYFQTLDYIKEKFQTWAASNYRRYNKSLIVNAIFNPTKQDEILTKGLGSDVEFKRYFWITANPSIWSVESIKEGGEIFYTAYNKKGNKRRLFEAFQMAQPDDKVIFYESTPVKKVVATGKITQSLHREFEQSIGDEVDGVSIKYMDPVDGITWEMISSVPDLEKSSPVLNKAQGSLFPITAQEYETILSLEEITQGPITLIEHETYKKFKDEEYLKIDFSKKIDLGELYFEDKERLITQIAHALKHRKHLILNGPPGTGKSKLAKEICKTYRKNGTDEYFSMVTATSDWSTFDTIGGYLPDEQEGNKLLFSKGVFFKCFQNDHNKPINEWLILDEINRADIDKAFGCLFSALTGDRITLSMKKEGNKIELIGDPKDHDDVYGWRFFIHPDWRIIATMNTFDKASLYEMSYAFMRRFAFINVNIPTDIKKAVDELIKIWQKRGLIGEIEDDTRVLLVDIWEIINKYRKVGPAIIEDIIRFIDGGGNIVSALTMYVFPQLEGLSQDKHISFVKEFKNMPGFVPNSDYRYLVKTAVDFFDIAEEKFNEQNI